MIRQLHTRDIPEIIRLILENSTLHTKPMNRTIRHLIVDRCIRETLLAKDDSSVYYGEFNDRDQLLSWRRLHFWADKSEKCCTIGLNFATNTIPLEKVDGTSKTLLNLITRTKKVIEDRQTDIIYGVKPYIKEWRSSSFTKGFTVTKEEVIEPYMLSVKDIFNRHILTFRTDVPRLIYSMKKPL